MPRSPLLSLFLQAHRALAVERTTGIPASELLERGRARRMQRREWLAGAGAAGVALSLPACGSDEMVGAPGTGASVAIVGGGMAGLHCAYRLKTAGVVATVYDAAKRVGGRMWTDRDTFAPQHCELGGELIDTGHATMHALAAELGIELYDYSTDDTTLADTLGMFGGNKLDAAAILTGYAPIAAKIDEALTAIHDPDGYITYQDPNGAEALDAMSLEAWFDSVGASGDVRALLEVAYVIEYGLDANVTNALNMLWLISTATDTFQIFGDSDELFHAVTGNDTFISKLAAKLDPSQIELSTRLEAIDKTTDGRYQLTFSRDAGSLEVTADHVVLALPFTMLRDVEIGFDLPAVKRKAIDELGYGTNSKLMCGFDARVWRQQGSTGETYSDLGYQNSWETSRLQPGDAGILTDYTGGTPGVAIGSGTDASQRDAFVAQLEQVFPGVAAASNGKVARFSWPGYELTKGSYAAYKVGQYSSIAGAEIERVENLHFAGEHTSLDAQGYMEGAALTGAMAADEVAQDLGVSVPAWEGSTAAERIVSLARIARDGNFRALKRAGRLRLG